jgi:hypothetical protein
MLSGFTHADSIIGLIQPRPEERGRTLGTHGHCIIFAVIGG